ncbi:hypothetical protein C211_11417 [Stutzerimonas degradans]|nr:hypothetical protein C211_11417 [Stutzerimonas degradans]
MAIFFYEALFRCYLRHLDFAHCFSCFIRDHDNQSMANLVAVIHEDFYTLIRLISGFQSLLDSERNSNCSWFIFTLYMR